MKPAATVTHSDVRDVDGIFIGLCSALRERATAPLRGAAQRTRAEPT